MKTNLTSDSMMVGESLQRPADLGVLTRPVLELAREDIVTRLPSKTVCGSKVFTVQPEAAGGGSEITEHHISGPGRQPPAYTEPWRGVRACRGRRPLDPCRRPPPVSFPPDIALQTASRALRVLEEIADDDVHFGEAIAKIESWLKERKVR